MGENESTTSNFMMIYHRYEVDSVFMCFPKNTLKVGTREQNPPPTEIYLRKVWSLKSIFSAFDSFSPSRVRLEGFTNADYNYPVRAIMSPSLRAQRRPPFP